MKRYRGEQMTSLNLTIYSDYAWPFCYIGKGIVDKLSQEYPLNITWVGYELRPERPAEGEDLAKLFPDFDPVAANERFNKLGAEYGIVFRPVSFLPNTKLALKATEYAKEQGLFEEFHAAVFHAYFSEGLNIGSREVILGIAASLGMDKAQMAAALEDARWEKQLEDNRKSGQKWQVTGLPTFILQDEKRIVGAQTYATFKKAIEQYLAP